MKISVCVIGLNEEKNLPDCLKSVKGIADEIVYVDSFSSDKSCAIAKKFGARVFKQKFLGHVGQKNFAVKKAKNDWILSLDCDERLSDKAVESIYALLEKGESGANGVNAYSFNRKNFYIYRWINHSGWYPDTKVRLFNRKSAEWQGENPHDRVRVLEGKTEWLKGDILHYSFTSISDHIRTLESFSTIAAQEAFKKGRKVSLVGVFFRSGWVVIRKFFFELAFLDGAAGFVITYYSAVSTFSKYIKLYMLHKTPHPQPPLHKVERGLKSSSTKQV
ncbi:MAG: hypothetical protein LDLANPLL_01261 [Turneriella sp.]|nr:hypothetical protein [Turneriella sp.]